MDIWGRRNEGLQNMFFLSRGNLFVKKRRYEILFDICDALCDLASFAQFKKRQKHPW